MPDTKITALAAITTVDPAADVLPIVDISDTSMAASGTTKKITSNQILGAGGTATLASATITGDLTVDTSTLKVDSTNNRVGIGTATPDSLLQMAGAGTINWKLSNTSDSVTVGAYAGTTTGTTGTVSNHPFFLFTNNTERYRLDSTGIATWSNVGGVAGTAMTLNSTGLAIGDTAFAGTRLTLRESASQPNALAMTNRNATQTWRIGVDVSAVDDKILGFYDSTSTTFRMQLTDTGNLGIGVTPSALSGFGTTLRQKGVGAAGGIFTENNTGASWFGIYSGTSTSDAAAVTFTDGGSLRFAKTTAVGVTGFTELLRLKNGGQLRFVPLASDPAGAEAGDVYYNSSSNKLKCYNGSTWNDLF